MDIVDTLASILNFKSAPQVWTIGPEETVFTAIERMSAKNVGALPVVEAGTLVGIVSERDYTRKVILRGRSSRETPVRDIMTTEVLTSEPSMKVLTALHWMTERSFRHLPIVQEGELVGIVSIGDLVRHVISSQAALIDQLKDYVIGSYPS